MRKKLFGLISMIFIVMLLGACGQNEDEKTNEGEANEAAAEAEEEPVTEEKEAELGDYEVQLDGEVTEQDNTFVIEGKSNLLPGSRLVGEVVVVTEGEKEVFSDTTELVQEDGSFHMELEHHEYGEAEIIVRFDFNTVQDDEIKRHYGEKGQKLEGPFIYKHEEYEGILKKAEAKIDYVPGETTNLAIQAPDWYDLPDDYGDPRIWIEVEELTEDGEFFYLHGRSNIMEGSEIKVEYRYNKDKTQVKPDGSFDFKFDYEYLEDKDIVITFEPYGYQWNEIEEAYGKKGQKLVGDLVVNNKYSTDKQFIEKRIPWDGSFEEDGADASSTGVDEEQAPEENEENTKDEKENPDDEADQEEDPKKEE
ncbi:hypothetical protein ACLIBG_10835 [Virgibacillus sp. W0181]|uniref:hypothetical protein n=1 Tax=Virgibacillus sp. W0181 TaxID=3391581 RepID=UPI003F46970F